MRFLWRRSVVKPIVVSQARTEERRVTALEMWESRLATPSAGLRTIEAVCPIFRQWSARRHGVLTFRTTQVLTEHGCLWTYLCRIAGREPSPLCHHCDNCLDEIHNTIAQFGGVHSFGVSTSRSARPHRERSLTAGRDQGHGRQRESWDLIRLILLRGVVLEKESAENVREAFAELAICHKRPGRRVYFLFIINLYFSLVLRLFE